MSIVDDILEHHGVKGMRWGVRRSGLNTGKVYFEKNDGTKRVNRVSFVKEGKTKRKPPTSEDFKKAASAKATVKKGGTKSLSNAELQALVKRMNLEKQYKELSVKDKKKVVGAKFVGDVLQGIGKQQAQRYGNMIAEQQINRLIKKAASGRNR